MNRSELVAALADRAEVTRKDADAVLAAFADVVGDIVSKGDETPSVRADMWAEDYVRLDKPMDLILSSGLGPSYDPKTFAVDYPK